MGWGLKIVGQSNQKPVVGCQTSDVRKPWNPVSGVGSRVSGVKRSYWLQTPGSWLLGIMSVVKSLCGDLCEPGKGVIFAVPLSFMDGLPDEA